MGCSPGGPPPALVVDALSERESRIRGEQRLYGILSHPVRLRIIELLGSKGPTGFTDLRKAIPVSVGSLYYHISVLGELLTQDEKKRYLLTDLGQAAFKQLNSPNPGSLIKAPSPQPRLSLAQRLAPVVSGSVIFQSVSLSPLRHVAEAALILALGGWTTSLAGLSPNLFFLFETRAPVSLSPAIGFALGWLAIYLISDVAATKVFKSGGGHLSLLSSSTYSLLPLILFAIIWLYHKSNPYTFLGLFDGWPLRILFYALQAWSLLLLASSISVSRRISLSKAFLIVLLLVYLNIAIILTGRIP